VSLCVWLCAFGFVHVWVSVGICTCAALTVPEHMHELRCAALRLELQNNFGVPILSLTCSQCNHAHGLEKEERVRAMVSKQQACFSTFIQVSYRLRPS